MVNNKYTLAWCAKENDVKNVQSVSEPVYVTKMTPHPASSIVRHAALRMFYGINDSINNITSWYPMLIGIIREIARDTNTLA